MITFALPYRNGETGKSEKFFDKIAIAARKRFWIILGTNSLNLFERT